MGGPSAWALGEVLTTPHRRNVPCYEMSTGASDLDWYCGTTCSGMGTGGGHLWMR